MKKQKKSTITLISLLLLMSSILNSCQKEEAFEMATIETYQVTAITEATATCGGFISADGGTNITSRGVCWNTSPNPTIENDTTLDAAGTGPFISEIRGLSSFKTYYVRAYATNKGGTAYGLQMTFTTKTLTFTTIPASFVMAETAISGGIIASDGDSLTILDRGVCWSTLPFPTITDSSTHNGRGKGSFTSTLLGLKPFTTYFARAYVTNSKGTTYGNDISFTTQNGIIGLSTEQVKSITATGASLSASITGDGGSSISECGVCWSTSNNPSLSNKQICSGQNSGRIEIILKTLIPNTTYNAWAYAINNVDTTFSSDISFKTRDGIVKINTPVAIIISPFDATITGDIIDDGGSEIIECGICWSTTSIPTLLNRKVNNNTPYEFPSLVMEGLVPKTSYNAWVYAINGIDTTYSKPVSVLTRDNYTRFSVPIVSDISSRSVRINCSILDDGGLRLIDYGFSYAPTITPTNSHNIMGSNINDGAYSCIISGLEPETTYLIRAIAITRYGFSQGEQTIYSAGEQISFTTEMEGNGTLEKPYTVANAIIKQSESAKWVTGYIVGYINTATAPYTYTYSANGAIQTNMLIADNPTEMVDSKCVPVQLPIGTIRDALNLSTNPTNLSKKITVRGDLLAYFSVPGVKTLNAYVKEGESPVDVTIPFFSETLISTLGDFSSINIFGDQLWTATTYGATMAGYANMNNNQNEDWLISPAINLTGRTTASLSFMHTINKGIVANMQQNHTLWVSANYTSGLPSTATWTKLSIPAYPSGADWTFVSSSNIALPATVLGNNNFRFAFKYLSTNNEASTWEIKTLKIVP